MPAWPDCLFDWAGLMKLIKRTTPQENRQRSGLKSHLAEDCQSKAVMIMVYLGAMTSHPMI